MPLHPSATPGSSIALTLDASSLKQLSNQGGTSHEAAAEGTPALVDGSINILAFTVTGGSAFVYGATTDNTTNDPSVQLARPIE